MRLQRAAKLAADLLSQLEFGGGIYPIDRSIAVPLAMVQSNQIAHFRRLANIAGRLELLSRKELANECFSEQEERFVQDLIQITVPGQYSGVERIYNGWYPELFYWPLRWRGLSQEAFHQLYGADNIDLIVADVHTDVPCPDCDDPGGVLHQAIGKVNLLMIAVERGVERMTCAGPVLSHFEFEVVGPPRRLTDVEWQNIVKDRVYPADVPPSRIVGLAPPDWTQSYLAP